MNKYVGQAVPRIDALDKVTGRAVYCGDIDLPGMLYGAILRSPLAHADIAELATAGAWKVPGVRAVVTGKDFPFIFGTMIKDQPFLAIDRVRYIGEPVAAVAADTEAAAQEAAAKIIASYDELPAVFDPRQAAGKKAIIIHEGMMAYRGAKFYNAVSGTNICTVRRYALGDIKTGFADSDEIFEDEFFVHAVAHTPMETHVGIAQFFNEDGGLSVWSPTDGPHRRVREISEALNIAENKVRIISSYSGGGFGGKGNLVAEAVAIALARFTEGRPVKVVFSREEELCASQTRIGAFIKLTTGVKKDGTLVARQAELLWDNGAYCSKAPDVAVRGALSIFGPYRIPHLELLSQLVYTNKEISGAYRGYGTTQVTMACESQMDIIAEKLGIDPVEIRLKNIYLEGDKYINGQVLQGVGLKDTLEKACAAIRWNEPVANPEGMVRRGKGIAVTIKGTATPSNSGCFIKVHHDGSVAVICSSVEVGAGQKTVLAQIAADSIGVPIAAVSVPHSNTAYAPYDFGVTSSRTTFHMGNAVRLAGQKARQSILELAAEVLKTRVENLDLADGQIMENNRNRRLTIQDIMQRKYGGRGGTVLAEGQYTSAGSPLLQTSPGLEKMSSIFWKFATHAAEVEVDIETGIVKVLRVAAAHDMGKAINPMGCEQQIEGAVIMGISNTLYEEFKMDNGRILNDTLADYKLATLQELPEILPILVESVQTEGPFGAKGIGEPAAAPTAPAIANAIYAAVGVRIKELPITPEKILAALRDKTSGIQKNRQ
jgi:CO/xanthine dehydrogenase Mo-binding subunit